MTPSISVVLPTCGRPHLLERCLDSLLAQRFDNGYEILVIDDGPSEATRQLVQRYGDATPAPRYLQTTEVKGPAAARNLGWRAARADLIAFIDDDTIADPHWLAHGRAALLPSLAAVWGQICMPIPDDPTDYECDAARLSDAGFVTANCFVRRDALYEVGGFDERFRLAWREDSDLHFRLSTRFGPPAYAARAIVIHPIRPARWGVSLTQAKKSLFDALLYKKHRLLYRRRVAALPPLRYYGALGTLFAAPVSWAAGAHAVALASATIWLGLTTQFALQRLRGTRKSAAHVAEMCWTSALLPPIAIFWRLRGAWRFKVLFL